MKTVQIIGHAFDCLPGHVTISARGTGGTVRVATQRAIGKMLWDKRLYRKRSFVDRCAIPGVANPREFLWSAQSSHQRKICTGARSGAESDALTDDYLLDEFDVQSFDVNPPLDARQT